MTDICYFCFTAMSCRGSMERVTTKGKIKVRHQVKEKVMITVMVTMGKKVNKKEKSETKSSKPETKRWSMQQTGFQFNLAFKEIN